MAKKERSDFSPELLAQYDLLISGNPEIERKGAAVPYTSLNGHMFSYLHSDGTLALRLPKNEIEVFLAKYKTTLREAYGIIQKEYVVVPDVLMKKTKELKPWFDKSFEYAKSLKPKPKKKG